MGMGRGGSMPCDRSHRYTPTNRPAVPVSIHMTDAHRCTLAMLSKNHATAAPIFASDAAVSATPLNGLGNVVLAFAPTAELADSAPSVPAETADAPRIAR